MGDIPFLKIALICKIRNIDLKCLLLRGCRVEVLVNQQGYTSAWGFTYDACREPNTYLPTPYIQTHFQFVSSRNKRSSSFQFLYLIHMLATLFISKLSQLSKAPVLQQECWTIKMCSLAKRFCYQAEKHLHIHTDLTTNLTGDPSPSSRKNILHFEK